MVEAESTQQLIHLAHHAPWTCADSNASLTKAELLLGYLGALALLRLQWSNAQWGNEAEAETPCASSGGKDVSIDARMAEYL
jgi:hypothetical protein